MASVSLKLEAATFESHVGEISLQVVGRPRNRSGHRGAWYRITQVYLPDLLLFIEKEDDRRITTCLLLGFRIIIHEVRKLTLRNRLVEEDHFESINMARHEAMRQSDKRA